MRPILLLIVSFVLSFCPANAVIFNGIVTDGHNGELLGNVTIENVNSHEVTYSDNTGNFYITVNVNDSLVCSAVGYENFMIYIRSGATLYSHIRLTRKVVLIDTVVIQSLTQYQKDSLERRAIYGKALDKKPVKFGLAKGDPLYDGRPKGAVTFNAPISSLIQKRTKKYKRLKSFQQRFQNDEKLSYIDSRYSPEFVTGLTGLQGDSLALFLKTFPASYNFIRSATDLELKMWVKYNYRTWTLKPETIQEEKP